MFQDQSDDPDVSRSDGHAIDLLQQELLAFSKSNSDMPLIIVFDGQDETEDNPYGEAPLARRLCELKVPHNIGFIIASRPTKEFRKLVLAFDIDLDTAPSQITAIRTYYKHELHTVLHDQSYSLDLEELIRRTERSFLYATLAVRDILDAHKHKHPYDMQAAPKGLAQRLDTEWERLTKAPLQLGQTVRLLAIIAAQDSPNTLDALADLSQLTVAEVKSFLASHGWFFTMEKSSDDFTHPPRLCGFLHEFIQESLVTGYIGETDMIFAHSIFAERAELSWRNLPASRTPALLQSLLQHAFAAR
jgi:hypothetical protein